ncbi:MAG: carboxypeptidase-like regulatory domain-containing protein [Flavobacteriales bacterium]
MNVQGFVRALFVGLFIVNGGWILAQATIRGFVTDKSTGEPAIFVTVSLEGTSYGVTTDVTGYYTLSKIPAGTYTINVSSVEFETKTQTVTLEGTKVVTVNFQVSPKVTELQGVEISAEQAERKTEVKMSVETLRPVDIKRIPSFGGQQDIVQALQVLPGFVSTGDQGGQLYIRGGSPVQNKVLLDGMIIYNAFHSIGLFSVFDTDIIANADVYTGGFTGEFGGRISSVMDITTRDGNKKEFRGKFGASPFGAKLLLEGPIKKLGENGGGISYVVSAKRSYLEQSSKLFYNYIDDAGLPFNFTDIYGKLSFGGQGGSKFNLFGFSFNDDVRFQALSDLNWYNVGGGMNFVVVPPGSPVLISGQAAFSEYSINIAEENLPDRTSTIGGFNFGLDFKYILGEDDIKYGIEIVTLTTDFETFNPLGVRIEQEDSNTELAGYFAYKKTAGKWLIQPSLRLQYYGSLSFLSPEPRLGLKYNASEVFRLKGAVGRYSQNLMQANSDRDVVNLFVGFLTAPRDLQRELTLPDGSTRDINNSLQTANHFILGFEYDFTEKFNVNVEGYIKDFRQVTNLNRNKLFPDNFANADVPEALRKDYLVETGISNGVDFLFKWNEKHSSFWLVYSLAKVNRWDGFITYAPVFDRRHNVNLVVSQAFGKDRKYEVSCRWNLGSGFPFTQTQGYFQAPNVSGGIGADFINTNSPELGVVYGELNQGRLPAYHRLDLNLRRTWDFSRRVKMEANAGVTNVYSRENIFYFNRVTNDRVNQLPILPSLGIDITF